MNREQKAKEYLVKFDFDPEETIPNVHDEYHTNLLQLLSGFGDQSILDYQNQKQVDGVKLEEPKNYIGEKGTKIYKEGSKYIDEWKSTLSNKEKIEDHPKKVEEIERLKADIKKTIESLQFKHDAFLGTKGEEARKQFKLGLSWAIDSLESLLSKQ